MLVACCLFAFCSGCIADWCMSSMGGPQFEADIICASVHARAKRDGAGTRQPDTVAAGCKCSVVQLHRLHVCLPIIASWCHDQHCPWLHTWLGAGASAPLLLAQALTPSPCAACLQLPAEAHALPAGGGRLPQLLRGQCTGEAALAGHSACCPGLQGCSSGLV